MRTVEAVEECQVVTVEHEGGSGVERGRERETLDRIRSERRARSQDRTPDRDSQDWVLSQKPSSMSEDTSRDPLVSPSGSMSSVRRNLPEALLQRLV